MKNTNSWVNNHQTYAPRAGPVYKIMEPNMWLLDFDIILLDVLSSEAQWHHRGR